MIVGNLLNRAMNVTGSSGIQWFQATGTITNAIGLRVTTFASPIPLRASVQPMPGTMIQFLGLDANKEYIVIYSASLIAKLQRDISGDQIGYNGFLWQIMTNTDWQSFNGWNGTVAVKIGSLP